MNRPKLAYLINQNLGPINIGISAVMFLRGLLTLDSNIVHGSDIANQFFLFSIIWLAFGMLLNANASKTRQRVKYLNSAALLYVQNPGLTTQEVMALIYFMDWKLALDGVPPMFNELWLIHEQSPVNPLAETLRYPLEAIQRLTQRDNKDALIRGIPTWSAYLSKPELLALDYAWEVYQSSTPYDFNNRVRTTYPVLTAPKDKFLDLHHLAKQYLKNKS